MTSPIDRLADRINRAAQPSAVELPSVFVATVTSLSAPVPAPRQAVTVDALPSEISRDPSWSAAFQSVVDQLRYGVVGRQVLVAANGGRPVIIDVMGVA